MSTDVRAFFMEVEMAVNYKQNDGSKTDESVLDIESSCLRTIDTEHSKIHEGKAFIASTYKEDLADDAEYNFLIKNTDVSELHAVFAINFEGNAIVDVFEGTTVSADGTEITVYNRKRSSTTASGATAFHTPTITDDGTSISKTVIPGASGPNASGGNNQGRFEWLLKVDTNYMVRVKNIAGAAKSGTITADFYIE